MKIRAVDSDHVFEAQEDAARELLERGDYVEAEEPLNEPAIPVEPTKQPKRRKAGK